MVQFQYLATSLPAGFKYAAETGKYVDENAGRELYRATFEYQAIEQEVLQCQVEVESLRRRVKQDVPSLFMDPLSFLNPFGIVGPQVKLLYVRLFHS